jgi:hypothetical protein
MVHLFPYNTWPSPGQIYHLLFIKCHNSCTTPHTFIFLLSKGSFVQGIINHGICFRSLPRSAFTNADWAGDPTDRRSTSGYKVFLNPNLITSFGKKQTTVSPSVEICWLHMLFKDLRVYLSHTHTLWCDNVSTLALASNPLFHACTKHIEVDFHLIKYFIRTYKYALSQVRIS